MRALIFGYTGYYPNLGCKATTDGICYLLKQQGIVDIDLYPFQIVPLPLLELFVNSRAPKNRHVISRLFKSVGRFAGVNVDTGYSSHISLAELTFCVDKIITQDNSLVNRVRLADIVIVNGEGTIHHNRLGALALLVLSVVGKRLKKPVYFINSTFEAMNVDLLKHVLGSVNYIAVRETQSWNYLKELGLESVLAADCAFLGRYDISLSTENQSLEKAHVRNCIFSPGINAQPESVAKYISVMTKLGLGVKYLMVCPHDIEMTYVCEDLGIEMLRHPANAWREIPALLRHFDLVVSGRHHLNIFSLIGGVPFIPLTSSSWKIEGTCELMDWPIPVARCESELTTRLYDFEGNRQRMSEVLSKARETGVSLAMKNLPLIK